MKNLLFWALLPFLIPQALYVRRTAPRFAAADGPTEGYSGKGESTRLLAIGDSIIAGVGASVLSKALVGQSASALANLTEKRVEWQALGASGYTSQKVNQRLVSKLPEGEFNDIIVSVGVNDITGLVTLGKWRSNLSLLLDTLRAHSPSAHIAVAGMPPLHGFPLLPQPLRAVFGLRGKSFDEATKEIIKGRRNVVHVPLEFEPDPEQFSADGYHPSEASYTVFGQTMAEELFAMRGLD